MKCRWDKILLTGISKGPLSLRLNSLIFFAVCNLNRKLLLAPGCPFFLENALKSLAELFWEWACVEIHPLGGTKNPENLHLTSFFSLIHTLFSTSVLYWSSSVSVFISLNLFPVLFLFLVWFVYGGSTRGGNGSFEREKRHFIMMEHPLLWLAGCVSVFCSTDYNLLFDFTLLLQITENHRNHLALTAEEQPDISPIKKHAQDLRWMAFLTERYTRFQNVGFVVLIMLFIWNGP